MHCFGVINAHGVIIVSAGAVSNYKLTHVIWIYKLCMAEEGGRRGGESTTTKIHTKVRYGGIPPPSPYGLTWVLSDPYLNPNLNKPPPLEFPWYGRNHYNKLRVIPDQQ